MSEYVFNSPYFKSKHGSGVVTIQKGGKTMVLDFNKTTVANPSTLIFQKKPDAKAGNRK
jgi:DNA-binding FadR family transcriptional regulator